MSKNSTNKSELVLEIQKLMGKETSKAQAERSLDAVLDAIKKCIKKGHTVQLIGFGSFAIAKRAARQGINPRTRLPMKIKASKTVKFRASTALKSIAAAA